MGSIILGPLLDKTFEFHLPPPIPEKLLKPADERAMGLIVARWHNVILNEAFRVAAPFLGFLLTWGAGSMYPIVGLKPDWASSKCDVDTNGNRLRSGNKCCNLPGETKFCPSTFNIMWADDTEEPDQNQQLVKNSFEQVVTYAQSFKTRYCYLLTNVELNVIRIMRDLPQPIGQSLAERPHPRLAHHTISQSHREPSPGGSVTEEDISIMSTLSIAETANALPEFVTIAWEAEGPKQLTVNLALFALHVFAALSSDVRDYYDPIESDKVHLELRSKLRPRQRRR